MIGDFLRNVSGATAAAMVLGAPLLAHADCLDDAATFQHVNVSLMRGIALVESGMNPDRINVNANGTTDIGLMQINSSWLPVLAHEGITEQSLLDACTNAYVGAWILAKNIHQFGPTWNAIGAYNAASPDKRLTYARKVYDAIQTISVSPDSPMPILPPSYTPPQVYNPFSSLNVSTVQVSHVPANHPASSPAALSSSASYNFGWTISGADQAKPIQVFDDGSKVYIQFSDLQRAPAIFEETPTGRILLHWEPQFPYAVVPRSGRPLIFRFGQYEARAQRSLSGSATAMQPASASAAAPVIEAAGKPAPASPGAPELKLKETTDALWYINK